MNFIIQKLKSKHFPQKIYKLSKTNIFFSRFEGTRGEKTQILRTYLLTEILATHVAYQEILHKWQNLKYTNHKIKARTIMAPNLIWVQEI